MPPLDWKYLTVVTFAAAACIILLVQIHRIWQMRYILKHYVEEVKTLNTNIEKIIRYVNDKSSRPVQTSDKVCERCYYRQTYVTPFSPGQFEYKCKLDQRAVILTDTCKRFQRDFQNTQI